jgi:hypothetical protein
MRNLEENTFALKLVTFEDGEEPVIEVLPYMFVRFDSDLNDLESFKKGLCFDAEAPGPAKVERHKEDIDFEMFEYAARELARQLKLDDRLSLGHSDDVRDPYFMPALLALALHGERRGGLGLPYIEHPRSVVMKTEVALVENTWTDRDSIPGLCAAWLQNVLSSNATDFYRRVDLQDLSDWGVSDETLEILDLLTQDEGTSHDLRVARILSHSTARALKLTELAELIVAQQALGGDTAIYEKQLTELGYHPEVDIWMPTLLTGEILSGWPRYGLAISEELAKAQLEIPARFRFARDDMDALDALAWGPGPGGLEPAIASDDQLARALFCGYFARLNKIHFNLEALENEWRFRGAVGKPVDPRFLSSGSVSLKELQARATRTFANQNRFVAALYDPQNVQDNGFVRPSTGPYSLLDGFANDELAEMAALGMSTQFGEHPYGHEYKTILGAILYRIPRDY